MNSRTVGPDAFARTLEDMLGEVTDKMADELPKAVSASARLGREKVVENASRVVESHSGRYLAGWANRRKTEGRLKVTGYVYNRDVPGLAHLLEKGHAKVGGGRVAARVHIAPAAEEAFDEFERRIERAVDSL